MLPPLVIYADSHRRSCILDVPLALSRFGLLCAMRMAQELNVWLIRALWEVLDNTQYYLENPHVLLGQNENEEPPHTKALEAEQTELVVSLNQWQAARLETDLAGLKFYWTGDQCQESLLPKDCDVDLVTRYEILASSLDVNDDFSSRFGFSSRGPSEFSRDAVALAGALIRYRPVVLTTMPREPDDRSRPGEPSLCKYLRQSGIPCERVESQSSQSLVDNIWWPIFHRNGVTELVWAGLHIAAVHIVAPSALVMQIGDRWSPPQGDEYSAGDDPARVCWDGASAHWYPIH